MTNKRKPEKQKKLVDLLKLAADYLGSRNIESARLESEMLLSDLLGYSRVQLYLNYDRPLTEDELQEYRNRLKRRSAGEPLQYILGYTEFYNIRIKTAQGVFIPRPESELIIELAEKNKPVKGFFRRTLDLGCGSGALALSLLNEKLALEVVAVDKSTEAFELTRENAVALGFKERLSQGNRVDLVKSSVTSSVKNNNLKNQQIISIRKDDFLNRKTSFTGAFNLIVSNPPYIEEKLLNSLPVEVRKYEPKTALISGADGLDAHRWFAITLPDILADDGLFLGEIEQSKGVKTQRIHQKWGRTVIHKDLAGNDRVIEVWR